MEGQEVRRVTVMLTDGRAWLLGQVSATLCLCPTSCFAHFVSMCHPRVPPSRSPNFLPRPAHTYPATSIRYPPNPQLHTHAHVPNFGLSQLWMLDGLAGCTLGVNTISTPPPPTLPT
jgi:hypothetical protein